MPQTNLLTRTEFGEAVYQAAKAEIESRGFSLWVKNFPPDYPVSLRQLANIRKGKFDMKTVSKIPGVSVAEWFTLEVDGAKPDDATTTTVTIKTGAIP